MKRPHFALPEIYDDSLSYYDVLRKLIKSMHVISDNLNKIPEQIANEAKAREQADSTLQTNIDNEAMARQEADNELRELISTSGGGVTEAQLNEEVTARQQADTVLDGKISELKSDLANKLPKSPTNWEAWTDEEQAVARERMGISEEFERVFLLNEIWEDETRLTVDVNNLSHFRIFMSLDGGVTSRVADYGLISCTDSNGNKTDNFFELGNITESILANDQVAYCQYDINDIPTMARWGQAGGNPAVALRGGLLRSYSTGSLIPNFLVSKIHFPPIKGRVKISIWGC